MTPRPLAAGAAALAAALLTGTLVAAPAQAAPPTTRTVEDRVEPGKGYDIVQVTLRSTRRADRPAVVVVKHGRKVTFGDAIEVWFDLDGDRVPDLHLAGNAFSEFTVHRAKSFTKDGKDISDLDCVRLAMAGTVSKIRLFPECVDLPNSYAVSVKSSNDDQDDDSADDWAPREERFTKRVLTVG